MDRCPLLAVLLFALLLAGQGPVCGDEPAPASLALRPEDKAFFAWWDSLEYPDVGHLPFVQVSTGLWSERQGEEPEPEVEHGFLISQDGGTVRVFVPDLTTRVAVLRTDPKEPWESIRMTPADLEAFVARGLAVRRVQGGGSPMWGRAPDPFRAHLWAVPNQSWRMLVLARACAARGRADLARALCDLAVDEGESPTHPGKVSGSQPAAYYAFARTAIAIEAWLVWEQEFASDGASWEDLAREAERLGRAFERDTPEVDRRGSRSAKELRAIGRELAAHRERRATAGPPTSEEARIADLVALLPSVRVAWDAKQPPTAEDDLVAIGLPAVPALIEALGDLRFTRKLDAHFSGRGQYRAVSRVLHANEVAYAALVRIAAGALPSRDGFQLLPAPGSAEHAALLAQVRAWHGQVRTRGEAPLLAEIASRGGPEAYEAANRLAKLDPAAVIAPTLAGIRAAKVDSYVHNLMLMLTKLPGEAGWPAVERLLDPSEDLMVRSAAAEALLPRKPEVAVPVFIEAWQRPAPLLPLDSVPGSVPQVDPEARRRHEMAMYPLAVSGVPQAYEALGAELDARGAWERFAVVISLVAPDRLGAFHPTPYGFGVSLAPNRPLSPEAAAIIERVLGDRLEDTGRATGLDLTVDDVRLDPVIGETAAWGLARRFPGRWSFDPKAPAEARVRARLTAANAWRARQGKPPLPVPEPRARPAVVPLGEVAKDLELAATSPDLAFRTRALVALTARGLPVFPALRLGLERVAADTPGRADLEALVRRLALTVATVELAKDAPTPDAALRALLDSKVGQPLSGELYTSILLHVAQHMPAGAAGIRLVALREDPALGVRLEIELVKDPSPASGSQTGWEEGLDEVWVGQRLMQGGGGFFGWEYGREAKAWIEMAESIDSMLAKGTPDEAIAVRGHLVGTK